ncbi:MAG: hypothetical protein IKT40_08805 [Bacilli bacterium]|nr:hypothetical protein [Bacilli bacterium]
MIKQKLINEKYDKMISYLNNMQSFKSIDDIPNIPLIPNDEEYKEYVVKNYIRCGAIPKDKLVIGKTYIGSCRNSEEATWLGKYFEYQRTKFGIKYKDKINHFEDDNGFDLFVPLFEKEE